MFMNKARKTILAVLFLVAVFGFGFLSAGAALAENPPSPNEGGLEVEFEQTPLFGNEEGNFIPGNSVTRWVKVTNNTSEIKKIAVEAINYPKNILGNIPDDDLSQVLTIIIRKKGGNDIYGGSSPTGVKTLADFYENGETYLSDIAAKSNGVGDVNEYEFEVSFPESKGDKWQGATTKFDIIVGFQGEDDNSATTSSSGGGGVLPPGLIIKYEQAIEVTSNSATITWLTSHKATSQVVYSSQTEYNNGYAFDLTKPNYGYAHAAPDPEDSTKVTGHSVTISGLTSGTTYYFRCVSHASPPTISRSHTFTTLALANDNSEEQPTPSPSQEGNNQESDDGNAGGGFIPETYQRWVAGATDFIDDTLELFRDKENKDGEVRGEEIEKNTGGIDKDKKIDKDNRTSETEKVESFGEGDEKDNWDIMEVLSDCWWLMVIIALAILAAAGGWWWIWRKKKEKEEN